MKKLITSTILFVLVLMSAQTAEAFSHNWRMEERQWPSFNNHQQSWGHEDSSARDMGRAGYGTSYSWHEDRFNDFEKRREEMLQRMSDRQNNRLDEMHERLSSFRERFSSKFPHFPGDENDDNDDTNGGDDDYVIPAACEVDDIESATNFPPQEGSIIALGNSLTAGVGASANNDYVSELEDMTGRDIINAGVSGDTTQDALNRLERDVLRHDPRAVIVFLGGNDALLRYYDQLEETAEEEGLEEELELITEALIGYIPEDAPLTEEETFENLETIVERIHDTGAVVILVGIDGEFYDENLSWQYREVANATGAIFVPDVLNGIIGNPFLMSDLVHPNDAGYDRVADRIYDALACVE